MSRLSNLLRQVETQNPQLAADLKREVEALSGRRAFGLNFERHIPETVELPGRPVRRGDKVRFLPDRGEEPTSVDNRLWRVDRISRSGQARVADLVRQSREQIRVRTTDDDTAVGIIAALDWVEAVTAEAGALMVAAPTARSGELTAALSRAAVYVTEMTPVQASLEEYFLDVTGEDEGASA